MNTRRFVTKNSLALLGIGAAAGGALGMYLYRSPRLRRQMRKAKTVKEATSILAEQIRHDSADTAHEIMAAAADNAAKSLKQTRSALGLRFLRGRTTARKEAKHLKREVKRSAQTTKAVATAAKNTAAREVEHVAREAAASGNRIASQATA